MASKAFLLAIIAFFVAIGAPATAKQIVVGDEHGWKPDFDFKAWSAGKQFYVGDTLVFNYKQGAHNVIKANQTQFQNCDFSGTPEPLTTGNDMITLAAPGKKWYICGVADHCSKGNLKVAVNVLPQSDAPTQPPLGSPGSSGAAGDMASSKLLKWMIAAAMASFFMIMA